MNLSKNDLAKKAAGQAAANLVENEMIVGLGTGSTAIHFIEALIERRRLGLTIKAVATSLRSQTLAEQGNIPLVDINSLISIDLTVDGADEITPELQMIKGGGGALLREKIVAHMSQQMIVIVDESKLVENLGKFPLPVEITPFAHRVTLQFLSRMGYLPKLRLVDTEKPYITDNGNYIADLTLPFPCLDPYTHNLKIRSLPGVVETGFFLETADQMIIGYPDGKCEIRR